MERYEEVRLDLSPKSKKSSSWIPYFFFGPIPFLAFFMGFDSGLAKSTFFVFLAITFWPIAHWISRTESAVAGQTMRLVNGEIVLEKFGVRVFEVDPSRLAKVKVSTEGTHLQYELIDTTEACLGRISVMANPVIRFKLESLIEIAKPNIPFVVPQKPPKTESQILFQCILGLAILITGGASAMAGYELTLNPNLPGNRIWLTLALPCLGIFLLGIGLAFTIGSIAHRRYRRTFNGNPESLMPYTLLHHLYGREQSLDSNREESFEYLPKFQKMTAQETRVENFGLMWLITSLFIVGLVAVFLDSDRTLAVSPFVLAGLFVLFPGLMWWFMIRATARMSQFLDRTSDTLIFGPHQRIVSESNRKISIKDVSRPKFSLNSSDTCGLGRFSIEVETAEGTFHYDPSCMARIET